MADSRIIDNELVSALCPERDEKGHKGTFGTVLICSGSRFMTGAQTLATESALRSGAGMVRVFAPEESMVSTRVNCPCAMFAAYKDSPEETVRYADELLKNSSSVLIGPGLDTGDKRNLHLLRFLIERADKLVIDASALGILSQNKAMLFPLLKKRAEKGLSRAVLTPHIGEFRRLAGEADIDSCISFSQEMNTVTVLKSASTFISISGKEGYTIDSPNSGMGKGGSGDVLAGLTAGLLAQGMSPEDAAVSAVYIHSLAGKNAAVDLGKRSMLPSDLPSYFTDAFEEIGWDRTGDEI